MDEKEIQAVVDTLLTECEWHFKNANNYYSMESEFERRENEIIRPIGVRLHENGGISLMRRVYSDVESICLNRFGKGCRSALDAKWNGIGEWMS